MNIAAWDGIDTGASAATVTGALRRAGLRLLRYPGGSWADEFDWASTTDTSACRAGLQSGCGSGDPLGFDPFAAQAHAAGASMLLTVNYGSGTPRLAASWVAHTDAAPGGQAALWEVGNESYSCSERNDLLTGPSADVTDYRPSGSVCPPTSVMAASYAAHAPAFFHAMKSADPRAVIGVPWAFTSSEAPGASVPQAATWNTTVLHALGSRVGFVDAHWYPFDSVASVGERRILESVDTIPVAAASIRATLRRLAPRATFVVGEENISEKATTLDFQPVAALFAAATSLEWISQGASSTLWWDLNNFGSPLTGDYGLLSSGPPETQPAGAPLPPYFGVLLASELTTPGSRLRRLPTSSPAAIGFRSSRAGRSRVLLVNTDPTAATTVPSTWAPAGSRFDVAAYGTATADRADPIVHTAIRLGRTITLPPESIVVLTPPT